MTTDQLDKTFAALASPARRAILERLAEGEATVTELAEPLTLSLPAVSKHLTVLENAELISRGRRAQWRPCRLAPRPLEHAVDWLESYRQFFQGSYARLEDHLREMQK